MKFSMKQSRKEILMDLLDSTKPIILEGEPLSEEEEEPMGYGGSGGAGSAPYKDGGRGGSGGFSDGKRRIYVEQPKKIEECNCPKSFVYKGKNSYSCCVHTMPKEPEKIEELTKGPKNFDVAVFEKINELVAAVNTLTK